jgi:uncharacterized beta-barrel protein YwiB (DUF1934 family)
VKGLSLIIKSNTDIGHVLISVKGSQQDARGEEDVIELFTHGKRYAKNGVHYITYQETEISGLEGCTTLLKIYADHVVLVRMGRIDQRQEFCVGERSRSQYVTPYGTMEMSMLTTRLAIDRTEDNSQVAGIHIEYELEIDGQWQSNNTLAVLVQGDKKNGH